MHLVFATALSAFEAILGSLGLAVTIPASVFLVFAAIAIVYNILLSHVAWVKAHDATIREVAKSAFYFAENLKVTQSLGGKAAADHAAEEFSRILANGGLPVSDQALAIAKDVWTELHVSTTIAKGEAGLPPDPRGKFAASVTNETVTSTTLPAGLEIAVKPSV